MLLTSIDELCEKSRNLANSFRLDRSKPSAMLFITDNAARRNWSDVAKSRASFPVVHSVNTSTTSSRAAIQHLRSSNFSMAMEQTYMIPICHRNFRRLTCSENLTPRTQYLALNSRVGRRVTIFERSLLFREVERLRRRIVLRKHIRHFPFRHRTVHEVVDEFLSYHAEVCFVAFFVSIGNGNQPAIFVLH